MSQHDDLFEYMCVYIERDSHAERAILVDALDVEDAIATARKKLKEAVFYFTEVHRQ